MLFLGYDQITLRGTIFGEHWLILTLAVDGNGPGKGQMDLRLDPGKFSVTLYRILERPN